MKLLHDSIIFYYIFIYHTDTDAKRRDTLLEGLNKRYSELIENFNIAQAYGKMVASKPYKLLSCFVFDWTYAPLKRRQVESSMNEPRNPKIKSIKSKAAKKSYEDSTSVDDGDKFLHPSHR